MVQSFPKGSTSERRIGTMPSVQEPSGEHLISQLQHSIYLKLPLTSRSVRLQGSLANQLKCLTMQNHKPVPWILQEEFPG